MATLIPVGKRLYSWKQKILILYFALRNPSTPLFAKLPIIFSFIYLVSPIDLIPDFIPVAGYVDDLIIVPLLLNMSIRLLPDEIRHRSFIDARKHIKKMNILLIVLFILVLVLLVGTYLMIREMVR